MPLEFKLEEDLQDPFLKKMLRNWSCIRRYTETSPENTAVYFDFVLRNSNEFLTNWSEIESCLSVFPRQDFRKALWKFVSDNLSKFLQNWFHIECAIKYFPEYSEIFLQYAARISDIFFQNMPDILNAKEHFPRFFHSYNEFFRQIAFKHPNQFFKAFNRSSVQQAFSNIGLFFKNHLEVSQIARVLGEGSRDSRGCGFSLFKKLPKALLTEIAMMTSDRELQTIKELKEVAEKNVSKPGMK